MKNNIEKYRKNNSLSIFELAERIDVSYSYLSALENDLKENPSYKVITKLLKYFKCSFEDLFPQT